MEIFGGSTGVVRWREGALQLGPLSARRVAFGVPDDALLRPPGGLFFGLLKRRAKGIRPTLLEQLPSVAAVRLELTAAPTLALSRKSLIARDDPRALKTVDLRPLGAPVQYLARAPRALFFRVRLASITSRSAHGASAFSRSTIFRHFRFLKIVPERGRRRPRGASSPTAGASRERGAFFKM